MMTAPSPWALSEYHAIGLVLYGEARGEPVEGRIAVANVLRARTRDARWPDTFKAVALQPKQFSCFNQDDPNYEKLMSLAALFLSDHAIATSMPRDPVLRECLYLAEGIIGNHLLDNVGGSNHYLTTSLFQSRPPAWARGVTPVATIGAHVFLKL